ncbi:hypothetical protein [Cohnella yongneupensis]|uniref:Uncharacterized protein n=1 Tax=Cohnella yongneupensis TaxID=425006 RepID=A0ABW0QU88_9BACL
MSWLQGGPFLEVSLLTEEVDIRNLINLVSLHKCVNILEENIEEKINLFNTGYLYDDEDSNSHKIHTISLNIFVELLGKRKSLLLIHRVAEKTLLLDFCFYGSEYDALEWGQQGIRESEYHHFVSFFSDVLKYFQGIAGTVAIEADILGLISETQTWPNIVFNYKNINSTEIFKQGEQHKNYIAVGVNSEEEIHIQSFESNS